MQHVVAMSWWEQHNATVVVLVLTAFVGLASSALTRRSERRSSKDDWLRDRRLEAYSDVLNLTYQAWEAIDRQARAREPGSPAYGPMLVASAALGRVELLGPEEIATIAGRFDHAMADLHGMVHGGRVSSGQRIDELEPGRRWNDEERLFRDAAKRVLR